VLVALVSVISVVLLTRQGAANEVRAFMFRGGVAGFEDLVVNLEAYYGARGSWEGVEAVLDSALRGGGPGQSGRGSGAGAGANSGGERNFRLRLADAEGNLVADTAYPTPSGELTRSEKSLAFELTSDDRLVGYLLPEGGQGYNRSEERYLLSRLNQAAITAGLIAIGLSFLLALLLAYRLMRPVRVLNKAAERLGQGDLSQRVFIKGNDELASLGRTFNLMATSLEEAQESRRAMTADIAHELRTPLAVQRAHLEALQDGIYPLKTDNLEPVLAQNILLTRLVDDLRTLALVDSGKLELKYACVDLVEIVTRVVERFQQQAAARQVTIELVFPEVSLPELSVDPVRIEQIIINLISNSLRYSPEDGKIIIRFVHQHDWVRVTVHDSGPGIPKEALPHLFDRFYRADKSRSRDEGGTGLGLAIARQMAEAHGGMLEAANDPQAGAVFTLTLPLSTISLHNR
jgi:signal transduction histidine kinase